MELRLYDRLYKHLLSNRPRDIKTSLSSFIRRAVIKYFNEEEDYWPLAFKHLNNTTMEIRTMHEELKRFCDAFIHYLTYYFMLWPHIPHEERSETYKHSSAMVENFMESFHKRLRNGGYLWKFTPEHMQELFVENAPELELEDHAERYDKEHTKDGQKPKSAGNKEPKKPNPK
jgi:hypothetical protein